MVKVWFGQGKLIIYEGIDKDFKSKYGHSYEQIDVIKDKDNIEVVMERLNRSYKGEWIHDYKVKKRFGWKYWSDELKEQIRRNISKAHSGKPRSEKWKKVRSENMKGKSIFKGQKHSEDTKRAIGLSRMGVDPIKGKRWCHDPATGQEKRVYELPEGYLWGRNPEVIQYFNKW